MFIKTAHRDQALVIQSSLPNLSARFVVCVGNCMIILRLLNRVIIMRPLIFNFSPILNLSRVSGSLLRVIVLIKGKLPSKIKLSLRCNQAYIQYPFTLCIYCFLNKIDCTSQIKTLYIDVCSLRKKFYFFYCVNPSTTKTSAILFMLDISFWAKLSIMETHLCLITAWSWSVSRFLHSLFEDWPQVLNGVSGHGLSIPMFGWLSHLVITCDMGSPVWWKKDFIIYTPFLIVKIVSTAEHFDFWLFWSFDAFKFSDFSLWIFFSHFIKFAISLIHMYAKTVLEQYQSSNKDSEYFIS